MESKRMGKRVDWNSKEAQTLLRNMHTKINKTINDSKQHVVSTLGCSRKALDNRLRRDNSGVQCISCCVRKKNNPNT